MRDSPLPTQRETEPDPHQLGAIWRQALTDSRDAISQGHPGLVLTEDLIDQSVASMEAGIEAGVRALQSPSASREFRGELERQMAYHLWDSGHREAAERHYRAADALGNAQAALVLGIISQSREEISEARAYFYKAVKKRHPAASYELFLLESREGNERVAERHLKKAADVGYPPACILWGWRLADAGRLKQAINCVKKGAGSDDRECLLLLGALYAKDGKLEHSLESFERAADLGQPWGAWEAWKLVSSTGSADADADRLLQQAVAGQVPSALLEQGNRLFEAGEGDAAVELWVKSAEAGLAKAAVRLMDFEQSRGNRELEAKWQERAVELGDVGTVFSVAHAAYITGDLDEAERLWMHAIDLGHATAMFNMGVLEGARENPSKADEWYQKAAALEEPNALAHLARQADMHTDTRPDAIGLWQRAARAGSIEGMLRLADHEERQGNDEGAREWWSRAAELQDPVAQRIMGVLASLAHDDDQAEHWWSRAAAQGDHVALQHLALFEEGRGNIDAARSLLQESPLSGSAFAFCQLGRLHAQAGEWDQALSSWETAVELGSPAAAVQLWARAREVDDDTTPARWETVTELLSEDLLLKWLSREAFGFTVGEQDRAWEHDVFWREAYLEALTMMLEVPEIRKDPHYVLAELALLAMRSGDTDGSTKWIEMLREGDPFNLLS